MNRNSNFFTIKTGSNNSAFMFQTFGIIDYIFFDDRLPINDIVRRNLKSQFDVKFYNDLKFKCIKIDRGEVELNFQEFLVFSKIVDFAAKCLIGDIRVVLKEVIDKDFPDQEFTFEDIARMYLRESQAFFDSFRQNCTNRQILDFLEKELNYF